MTTMVEKPPRGWRENKTLTEDQNLGLPIPRLEIRYYKLKHDVFARYSMVYRHLLGEIRTSPLGGTVCGGGRVVKDDYLDLPFRDGAHMLSDMFELRLPGYVVNGNKWKLVEPEHEFSARRLKNSDND